jgi:tRNA-specific 2-thiouridylase
MAPPQAPLEVEVQVRYRSAPERARLVPTDSLAQSVRLEFAEPQFSITPGQAAVFYAGEVVLGGGLIQA